MKKLEIRQIIRECILEIAEVDSNILKPNTKVIFKIKSYEPGKFHHQMQKYEGIIKSHKYKGSKLFYNVQIGSLLFLVSPSSVIEKKKSKNIWPKVPWGQYTNLSN